MSEYNCRIADAKDVKGIFRVMKNVGYIAAFYGDKSEEKSVPLLLDNLFDSDKCITVVVCEIECIEGQDCFDGKRIIGYSIFGPYQAYKKAIFPGEPENFAYSMGIGIHTDFQSKGLGALLKQAAENFARKQGYKGMYTDVAATNKPSVGLQIKAGYERVAELSDKSRPKGVNTVLFKKRF
jgi:ribosomal protein S18 acetylase RimI-like enzyme